MAYALKKVSPYDKEKILLDADAYPEKKLRLSHLRTAGIDASEWIFDVDDDSYLIEVPKIIREEYSGNRYYLFYDGHLIEARFANCFWVEVHFVDFPSELEEKRDEIQDKFVSAVMLDEAVRNIVSSSKQNIQFISGGNE